MRHYRLRSSFVLLLVICCCTGWILYSFINQPFTMKIIEHDTNIDYRYEQMLTFLSENGLRNIAPPHVDTNYVMENRELCSSNAIIDLLVMIESHPSHFDRRKAIRETWANISFSSTKMNILFVFGLVNNTTLQRLLEEEFKESNDILQGDFLDSYRNLSLSSIVGFKWINERCGNAKLIMKVDDDVVVNVTAILDIFKTANLPDALQVVCARFTDSKVVRKTKSKSYPGEGFFKNVKYYPPYCDGTIVLMTKHVIPVLLRSVSMTPYFWIEDVYLYGLVMNTIPDIKYISLYQGKEIDLHYYIAKRCLRETNVFNCRILVAGAYSGNEIREIWSLMMHRKKAKVSRYLRAYIYDNELYYERNF